MSTRGDAIRTVLTAAVAVLMLAGCTDDVPDDPVAAADAAIEAAAVEMPTFPEAAGEPGPWDVCDYADEVGEPAGNPEAIRYRDNLRTACTQARTGVEPDRPDIVACYARADEPGGRLAGAIATETCDRLAMDADPTPLEDFGELVR